MEIKNEHRLTAVEDMTKENRRRIEDMEKRQDNLEDLTVTVRTLAVREENIEKTVNEIKTDVKDINNKPVKRWDGLIDKAISAIVGGIIAYMMIKLGLGG